MPTGSRSAAVLAAFAAFCIGHALAGCERGYSHDSGVKAASPGGPGWMDQLLDHTPLSQLSLLGSHDTMAYQGLGGHAQWTQAMNLADQLNSGIRALDIRARLDTAAPGPGPGRAGRQAQQAQQQARQLLMYHGAVPLGTSLDDVMEALQAFLGANPREVVLMSIKREVSGEEDYANDDYDGSDDGDGSGTSGSTGPPYASAFERAFDQLYYSAVRYRGLFWRYDGASNDPLLGDVRGRVVVIDALPNTERGRRGYGIPIGVLDRQDEWDVGGVCGLGSKWARVQEQLLRASPPPPPLQAVDMEDTTAEPSDAAVLAFGGTAGSGAAAGPDTSLTGGVGPAGVIYVNYLSAANVLSGGLPYFFASGKASTGTCDPQLPCWCPAVNTTAISTSFFAANANASAASDRCNVPGFDKLPPRVGRRRGSSAASRATRAYKGLNQLTYEWPGWASGPRRVGVIMADFPDGYLISRITSQNALIEPSLVYSLRPAYTHLLDRCLDLVSPGAAGQASSSSAGRAPPLLRHAPCNTTRPGQRFSLALHNITAWVPVGNASATDQRRAVRQYVEIRAALPAAAKPLCLDAGAASTAGSATSAGGVQGRPCSGGTGQRFAPLPYDGGFALVALASGKCLSVDAPQQQAPGSPESASTRLALVRLSDCMFVPAQVFKLRSV